MKSKLPRNCNVDFEGILKKFYMLNNILLNKINAPMGRMKIGEN